MPKRRNSYSSLVIAICFIAAIVGYLWPIFLGAGVVWLLWKKNVTKEKTVAYIIIKDGYGKFGITKKRKQGEKYSVRKRYNNKYIKILWTTTLSSRSEGYKFERYCKTRINYIVKGREWFFKAYAPQLVVEVKAAGY